MTSGDEPRHNTAGRWVAVAGGAILPLAIVVAWWAVATAGVLSPRLLPPPQDVVVAGVDLAQRGMLVEHLAISLQRVVLGFLAGSALGLAVGVAVGRFSSARILVSPLIAGLRAVPTVAWFPVLLLYLGVDEAPKFALIAIGASFPVFTAAVGAFDGADPTRPVVVVGGLRVALAQSWVFLVAAELLHATAGVGFLLIDSSAEGRADRLIVGVLLIVALARLSDALMAWFERRLRKPTPAA